MPADQNQPDPAASAALSALTGDSSRASTPAIPAVAAPNADPSQPAIDASSPAGLQNLLKLMDPERPATPEDDNSTQPTADPAKPALPNGIPGRNPNDKAPRNLEGLSEEEAHVFQNMSLKAYNFLYPKYKQMQELLPQADKLKKLPEIETELNELRQSRWSDHPEAYRLSEEYTQLNQRLSTVSQLESHFKDQLKAIRSGAKEITMYQVDEDGGLRPVKVPVQPDTEVEVMAEWQGAIRSREQLASQVGSLKDSHAQRFSGYKSALDKIHEMYKPFDKVLKDRVEKELARLPAFIRSRPEAALSAKAIALVTLAGEAMDKAQKKAPAVAANQRAATQAPPSRDSITVNTGGASPMYSNEEYARLKAERLI